MHGFTCLEPVFCCCNSGTICSSRAGVRGMQLRLCSPLRYLEDESDAQAAPGKREQELKKRPCGFPFSVNPHQRCIRNSHVGFCSMRNNSLVRGLVEWVVSTVRAPIAVATCSSSTQEQEIKITTHRTPSH